MDARSPTLRLRIPTPQGTYVAFCKPYPRELKLWIEDLPKANIGETARLLYQALIELNDFKTPADNRIQLLELLRPEVMFINSQLEKHFLNNSIMLDERPKKVANLCQAIQNHLTIGYKLVIADSLEQRGTILALALQRSMHSMFASLVRTYQLYYPAPRLFWLELHQVYLLARKNNLHTQPISETLLSNISEQSIESAYRCALLLSCARINQMRQSDIALLARILPSWSHLSALQNVELASSLFVVNLNSDAPPRYKELIAEDQSTTHLGFNTLALAEALMEQQQPLIQYKKTAARLSVPENMSGTLIAQLCSAWGNIAKRDFQRTSSQGSLQVCLGMSAVHYYLAGQESFEQHLQLPSASLVEYNPDNSPPDIWNYAIDARLDTEKDPLLADLIEYQATPIITDHTSPEPIAPTAALYPAYALSIVNHSPGGYCLAWHDTVPAQLQAGEIIALRETTDKAWTTAVVRWIRQAGTSSTQMGIELIAPNAQPCGLQLLRSGDLSSNFLRALLVPEIPALSRSASLIVPRIPFHEGNQVIINQRGKELKAVLTKRLMNTGSVNQFEFNLLTPVQPVKTVNTSTAPTVKSKDSSEDFDSLWKSL
ncbi:MAG: molecular chaperone [Pseudomonas sp.]|jgi:hypothetical protein|nr:molecular chaperone [Pseudomonas sp.]MDD2222399.1 molecular chaperone [Pseudomonas sp.]MDY0414478.1 molecular chaperone [Pseudomonas sp.]NLO54096.1 molecular chaperone [Gammaproteobacteria bacterium]